MKLSYQAVVAGTLSYPFYSYFATFIRCYGTHSQCARYVAVYALCIRSFDNIVNVCLIFFILLGPELVLFLSNCVVFVEML